VHTVVKGLVGTVFIIHCHLRTRL